MRHVFFILLAWLLVSGVALAVAGVFLGWPATNLPVEVLKQPRTSFRDEALRAIFDSRHLAKADRPLLLLLGASVVQEAFPPSVMQPLIPDLFVNNLAIGASNVTEMDQVLDLVLKSTSRRTQRSSTLVLAVSYPVFVPDKRRWTHPDFVSRDLVDRGVVITDIEREALRCPLVLNPENFFFKLAPRQLLNQARQCLAVWLPLLDRLPVNPAEPLLKWPYWRANPLASRHGQSSPGAVAAGAPVKTLTPRDQMHWLTDYIGQPGRVLPAEQFVRLIHLIQKARRSGFQVVVISLPMPTWHRAESPFYSQYQKRLQDVLATFPDEEGVLFLDLSDAIPDDKYRDSVHPTPEDVGLWAKTISEALHRK